MKPEGIAEESWGEPGFIDSICQTTLIAASASAFLERNVMADCDVLSTQSEILYPEDSIFRGIIRSSFQREMVFKEPRHHGWDMDLLAGL